MEGPTLMLLPQDPSRGKDPWSFPFLVIMDLCHLPSGITLCVCFLLCLFYVS